MNHIGTDPCIPESSHRAHFSDASPEMAASISAWLRSRGRGTGDPRRLSFMEFGDAFKAVCGDMIGGGEDRSDSGRKDDDEGG